MRGQNQTILAAVKDAGNEADKTSLQGAKIDTGSGRRNPAGMTSYRLFAAIALVAAVPAPVHAEGPACPDAVPARAEIERTIQAFFDGLRLGDKEPLKQTITETFYAFDVGARFPGTKLGESIRAALDRGVVINWNLGPMDIEVRCDVAWSQWENSGSAGTPPDVAPVRWLESAVLVYEEGRWKIDFFHSQRARPE